MKRPSRSSLVVAVVTVLTVVQMAVAGVAFYARHQTQRQVEDESLMIASYRIQLASAELEPLEPVASALPRWELHASVEVAGTLQLIQSVGDAAGVTVASARASRSTTPGRQSFQISGRGSATAVCAFLAGIEQNKRLIVIETGKLTPGKADDVEFEFGLATYLSGGDK